LETESEKSSILSRQIDSIKEENNAIYNVNPGRELVQAICWVESRIWIFSVCYREKKSTKILGKNRVGSWYRTVVRPTHRFNGSMYGIWLVDTGQIQFSIATRQIESSTCK